MQFEQKAPNANMLPEELAAVLATMSPDACLVAWQESKIAMQKATDFETAMRVYNFKMRFKVSKPSGVNTVELGNGYSLKATTKTNYNLGKAEDVEKALKKIESVLGPDLGGDICRRLVSWKPSLSISEYKLLSAPCKKIIDTVLTTSDAKVSMEIVEPSAKK